MRVVIAGVLGGIAMFVWTSVAHLATPLGTMGFSQMTGEATVLPALVSGVGEKPGLYIFPWVDPNDPKAEEAYTEKAKTSPSGLLLYHPPGAGNVMMPATLGAEFAKETAQALIAAFLLSLTAIGAYLMRVTFVALIYVSSAIATNVSYWNWYGFPLDYTLGQITIDIVAGLAAGLVIAAIVRPRAGS